MKFSGINLLDELQRPELEDLRQNFRERRVRKGSIVFRPDEEEDLVFIISSGRVRIYLGYEDKEFTLGILNPGDLYSTHADCYVQALEDTVLLTTDVNSVKNCMAQIPLFNRTMVRVLGHILKNSFSVIDGLVFRDINTRLVDFLLKEAEDGTARNDGAIEIETGLTVEQLSQLLGATRQTVSTLINNLVRDGLIEKIGRSKWLLPDPEGLRARVEA
ncbi:Crp/Fnr family transcriptional regulator [Desulfovibrio oxyclinae]|uniref:Crp/Fnr family transcriptional regulator n=1 Tax=Desulfovibrio oxyclinae TaxID=63560 RepID=UPI0003676C20|nr:Crp/Fnr family transcriptional regulator [Desulfovibrio oxyclinae]